MADPFGALDPFGAAIVGAVSSVGSELPLSERDSDLSELPLGDSLSEVPLGECRSEALGERASSSSEAPLSAASFFAKRWSQQLENDENDERDDDHDVGRETGGRPPACGIESGKTCERL